ncbi:MAG: hypothetical protein IPG94_09530 [Kineosporiaceae bacterium]|nr:hypothetical protein [Kineosporiaceae bacterium]
MEGQTKLAAKLSWLPLAASRLEQVSCPGLVRASRKTLSNTILTDYLAQVDGDSRIVRLEGLKVTAPKDSMAFMKMYTPYMIIAKTEDQGLDLARLDEALIGAKGYYELLGEDETRVAEKVVLRFNFRAFRNNYGLTDLGRMRLVFHGVLVGQASEAGLGMEAEMKADTSDQPVTAADLIDGATTPKADLLDVYDVILAGVEYVNDRVTVYYGPVSWFKEELALETKNLQSLLEIVYERDEALRQLKIVQPDYHDGVSNDGKTQQERPQHVMAESSDSNRHVLALAGL